MVGCFIIALLEKFTGKSGSGGKRILKIGQHLTMLGVCFRKRCSNGEAKGRFFRRGMIYCLQALAFYAGDIHSPAF